MTFVIKVDLSEAMLHSDSDPFRAYTLGEWEEHINAAIVEAMEGIVCDTGVSIIVCDSEGKEIN